VFTGLGSSSKGGSTTGTASIRETPGNFTLEARIQPTGPQNAIQFWKNIYYKFWPSNFL